MAVTIRDVARHVGMSVQTVSRAINDHPDVSDATRSAVGEAVRILGYQPSPLARGLRTGSTGMIGLLVPEFLNPHYAEWARQMQALASAAGYMLVLANAEYDPMLALANLRSLLAHRIDGLIWMAGELKGEALDLIRDAKVPVVAGYRSPDGVDRVPFLRTAPSAVTLGQATYRAVEHLIGLGHQRIAYVTERSEMTTIHDRLSAFTQALTDHALPVDLGLITTDAYLSTEKLDGGYRAMLDLLRAARPPTAVCTSSDLLAIGSMRALREHGLRVPNDVSVVGCDDIKQASYTDPPLTTIRMPYTEITAATFRLLQHLLDPRRWSEPILEADYVLIVRSSSGVAPS